MDGWLVRWLVHSLDDDFRATQIYVLIFNISFIAYTKIKNEMKTFILIIMFFSAVIVAGWLMMYMYEWIYRDSLSVVCFQF